LARRSGRDLGHRHRRRGDARLPARRARGPQRPPAETRPHDSCRCGHCDEPQQPEDRPVRHARLLRRGRKGGRTEAGSGQAAHRRPDRKPGHPKHRDPHLLGGGLARHGWDLLNAMTRLAVVGAGTMVTQIAQHAALHGINAVLHDQNEDQLRKARASNQGHIARRVEKGRLSEEKAREALERVRETTDLREAAREADFVIEAVFEDLDVKRSIFHDLDEFAPAHAVLASNSSTIGISKIADATRRPDRCLNMHFFYPVLVMDLVEVVRGPQTSDETMERGMALAREMGRTPVLLKKEIDGFIVNRILHAATQEAYRLLDADVASFEDIDAAIQLYMTVFGAELTHRASNEKDGLAAAFLRAGDAEVELLAPLREDTPVGKFLAKRGPGLHHIAVAVPDIDRAIADARA